MKDTTTLKGIQYEAIPTLTNTCTGCAGLAPGTTTCTDLPDCRDIIWVQLTPAPAPSPEPDLDQVRTKGSFATSLADAYTLADSANRKTLLAAFPKVFQ